jgi:hypothetical protein
LGSRLKECKRKKGRNAVKAVDNQVFSGFEGRGGDDEDQRECVDQKSDRLRREAVETARPADVKKKASLVQ